MAGFALAVVGKNSGGTKGSPMMGKHLVGANSPKKTTTMARIPFGLDTCIGNQKAEINF